MLERLFEFLSQFGKHLLPFVVVPVYQNVRMLRLGKYHRTCGPGLHWKWPFIEDANVKADLNHLTMAHARSLA